MSEDFEKYFPATEAESLSAFVAAEFDYAELAQKQRLLSFMAACQASDKLPLLSGLVKWAIESDIKPAEIYELLLQGHLFLGYPRAIESFFIFREVIAPELTCPVDHPEENYNLYKSRGDQTARKVYGGNFDLVYKNIRKLSADLAYGMIIEGYGRIISRSGLDLVTRELAVVASLTVTDMPRQLYSHIKGALNAVAKTAGIKAAINQCRFFTDLPKIDRSLSILKKILGNNAYPR